MRLEIVKHRLINVSYRIFYMTFLLHSIFYLKAQETQQLYVEDSIVIEMDTLKKGKGKDKGKYLYYTYLRPSYNAFVGKDSDLMNTTFKGIGSLTEWNLVISYPFVFGNAKYKFLILPRTGVLWKKFRFAKNLVPNMDTTLNRTVFSIDSDLTKDYGSGFFSYGKTKLVVPTFRVNPELGISMDIEEKAIGITVGPVLDIALGVKYKQKFKQNGQKKKEVQKGNDKFNINSIQCGVSAAVMTPWVQFYGAYIMNPFFKPDKGPVLNTFEFGVILPFIRLGIF